MSVRRKPPRLRPGMTLGVVADAVALPEANGRSDSQSGRSSSKSQDSNVRICVGALLVQGENILLGKRTAASDFCPCVWDILGGHKEGEETLERTLRRELHEEIGVAPIAWRWLTTLHSPDSSCEVYELHVCLVIAWRGTPCNLSLAEHDEVRWFTVEDACRLPLAHPDYPALFRRAIAAVLPGERPE